jgi:Rab proteins geranylgeranyltransferase component A
VKSCEKKKTTTMDEDALSMLPDEKWDVILLGTSLSNSLISAALSKANKRVLHLDANKYYGQTMSSFSLRALHSFLANANDSAESQQSIRESIRIELNEGEIEQDLLVPNAHISQVDLWHRQIEQQQAEEEEEDKEQQQERQEEEEGKEDKENIASSSTGDDNLFAMEREEIKSKACLVRDVVELLDGERSWSERDEYERRLDAHDRQFNVDLAPQPCFGVNTLLDVVISAGVTSYMDFKAVERTLLLRDGELRSVPSSKSEVFKSKYIGLKEKRQLMKLLAFCREPDADELAEWADAPFGAFLEARGVSAKLRAFVLYSIAYSRDGECVDGGVPLTTTVGLARVNRFASSIARFPNMTTPFVFPVYGCNELPQAFCRLSAVAGSVFVLACAPRALVFDGERRQCLGVATSSGRVLRADHVVATSSYTGAGEPPVCAARLPESLSRCVCITTRSLLDSAESLYVTIPPLSAGAWQRGAISAFQLGASFSVVPTGHFLVSLSCASALASPQQLAGVARHFLSFDELTDAERPPVLFSASFALSQRVSSSSSSSSESPSTNLHVTADSCLCDGPELYDYAVEQAQHIFASICDEQHIFFGAPPQEEEDQEQGAKQEQEQEEKQEEEKESQ